MAAGQYAAVERSWQPGDRVLLDLDLRARFMEALIAIPYYAWANRDPGPMAVWMPTVR